MKPDQNSRIEPTIAPINEEAILRELASSRPVIAPVYVTQPEAVKTVDPSTIKSTYIAPLDPIEPTLTTQLLPSVGQLVQPINPATEDSMSPPPMGKLVPGAQVKLPWVCLVLTGIGVSLLYAILVDNILLFLTLVQPGDQRGQNNVLFVHLRNIVPYVSGLFVIFVANKFTPKLNPVYPGLLAIATLLFSVGFSGLLEYILLPISINTVFGRFITEFLNSGAYLGYICAAIGGVVSILMVTLAIRLLCTRITKNKLFIIVIIVLSLIPLGINRSVNRIKEINFYASQASVKKAVPPPPTTLTSLSTSSKPNIAYNKPALDGSGKYNDGNISFSYPVSSAYELGKHTNWSYVNVNDANSFTSLFSADYATDPKTHAKTFGAEIRIITSTLYGEDSQASTGAIERDDATKYNPKATTYDINTSDGSYAFGINSNNNSFDVDQFGAYFIKNKIMYHILLSSAPNDIPKYKPQLDLIISSFKFLK